MNEDSDVSDVSNVSVVALFFREVWVSGPLRGVPDIDQTSELFKDYTIWWMKIQGN